MLKHYKITAQLIVSMSEETKKFYDESPADLANALFESPNMRITCEHVPSHIPTNEHWGAMEEFKNGGKE